MNKLVYIYMFAAIFTTSFCTHSSSNTKDEIENKKIESEKDTIGGYLSQTFINRYIAETATINFQGGFPKPFDSIDFNKVIAYDFEGVGDRVPSVLNRSGRFVNVIFNQQALNKAQVEQFISFVTDDKTYGYSTAACFDPGWALVFFNNEQIVCVIDVCLDCNSLNSNLEIPAETAHNEVGEDYVLPRHGFSKPGRTSIKNLAKELGMQYGNYDDTGSIFE